MSRSTPSRLRSSLHPHSRSRSRPLLRHSLRRHGRNGSGLLLMAMKCALAVTLLCVATHAREWRLSTTLTRGTATTNAFVTSAAAVSPRLLSSFLAASPGTAAQSERQRPAKCDFGPNSPPPGLYPERRKRTKNALGVRGGSELAARASAVMGQAVLWEENLDVIGKEHAGLVRSLAENGQAHLFAGWSLPGVDDDKKRDMMVQLDKLNKAYPGGLLEYVKRSKDLLEAAQSGRNALEGFVPSVPAGERLETGSGKYHSMESKGIAESAHAAFVLVAGGLGERLGFGGIKISLPSELVSGKPYLQLYAEHILALQARGRESTGDNKLTLPLAIMTSGDTHDQTLQLLESNNYFGLERSQVELIKQQKVPALSDQHGSIALDPKDPYKVLTKPHGHGDVHTLLHQSGIAKKWANDGKRWIVFFQDTNGLIFQAVPALIGVSSELKLQVNTLTIPRRPGEAIGSICSLKNEGSGQQLTVNVEYNQLEPLLKSTVSPEGDVPLPETGDSPYPGNTNALVFSAEEYARVLDSTGGLMPEFVNPKYKDSAKIEFKKPTRLECMMQDYPRLLDRDARVGFTQLERWSCFAACKNNAADAATQFEKTGFAESASTSESAIYRMFARKLKALGAKVAEPELQKFNNVPTQVGPKISLSPKFAVTLAELQQKFPEPKKVSLSETSTLSIEGRDIEIRGLDLDGSLHIKAVDGAHVVVDGLKVKNRGWPLVPVDQNDAAIPEELRIRGYNIDKSEKNAEYVFNEPGEYRLP